MTTRTDSLQTTHDLLTAQLDGLATRGDWRAYLDVAARFHQYSAGNLLLILAQRPDASQVAGYRGWQRLGRQVRKGEQGIRILAPCTYRRPDDPDDDTPEPPAAADRPRRTTALRGFRATSVFDITQTDGDPLPAAPHIPRLDGDAPAHAWQQLADLVEDRGYRLERRAADRCPDANGQTDHSTRTVRVRPDLSPAQAVKTLAHELAHILLHAPDGGTLPTRRVAEVEAESVAYLTTHHLGLDSSAYTLGYVAGWSGGDTALVRTTADRVVACARSITQQLRPAPEPTPA